MAALRTVCRKPYINILTKILVKIFVMQMPTAVNSTQTSNNEFRMVLKVKDKLHRKRARAGAGSRFGVELHVMNGLALPYHFR
jgi:hypothetical protein